MSFTEDDFEFTSTTNIPEKLTSHILFDLYKLTQRRFTDKSTNRTVKKWYVASDIEKDLILMSVNEKDREMTIMKCNKDNQWILNNKNDSYNFQTQKEIKIIWDKRILIDEIKAIIEKIQ